MKICSSFLGKFDFPSFALMNAGNFSGWPTHRGQLNENVFFDKTQISCVLPCCVFIQGVVNNR